MNVTYHVPLAEAAILVTPGWRVRSTPIADLMLRTRHGIPLTWLRRALRFRLRVR